MGHASELAVPPDPAYAVVVRAFVASVGEMLGIEPGVLDDLNLAATELLASAIDGGTERFVLTLAAGDEGWILSATGVADLRREPADLGVARIDLLSGLFPQVEAIDGAVRIAERPTSLEGPHVPASG